MSVIKELKKVLTYQYTVRMRLRDSILYKMTHQSKEYHVDSVRSFCKANGIQMVELRPSITTSVFQPKCFEKGHEANLVTQITPAIYTVDLEGACIHGGNDSLIIGDWFLNDKIELKRAISYDFQRGVCSFFDLKNRHAVCSTNKQQTKIKSGINLFGQCSVNWYHWMIDILSRIEYINRFSELSDIPLLLDESIANNAVFMETLRLFDKNNHPIYILQYNHSYYIELLHYFSPTSFGNPFEKVEYTGTEDRYLWCVKNEEVLRYYRDVGLKYANDTESPAGKKLFIDRGSAMNGFRLKNEEDAKRLSEQYGYERFNPGKYSLKEQIAAFRDATSIIGDEGAAFVNGIFGSPMCKFTIILPQNWENYVFSTLIYCVGNQCEYLDASETGNDREHVIDIEYLRRYLENQDARGEEK